MAQALKNVDVAKTAQDKSVSTVCSQVCSQKTESATTPEATVLNFDKTKSFSRFLEASCDCC